MKSLLDDLVDFNRAKLGVGIEIHVADADLSTIISDELKEHQAANPSRQIVFTVQGCAWSMGRPPPATSAAQSCLERIRVRFEREPVRVALEGSRNEVSFEVRNRGSGIEPATAEQLLDPLNRGRVEASSNMHSMGLGLYIVREIVRAHGGEVEYRPEGADTVFEARLPRVSRNRIVSAAEVSSPGCRD